VREKNHNESFIYICNEGELDIAKAMMERTQVDLEVTWGVDGKTPLHTAAEKGHFLWCSTCASRGLTRR